MVNIVSRTVKAMTMPFTISIATSDTSQTNILLEQLALQVETELIRIEEKFSAFKNTSLVSQYQRGDKSALLDKEFLEVYTQTMAAKLETQHYFDPFFKGPYNPTGYVKGWAIEKVFDRFLSPLFRRPYIEAISLNGAGDMQVATREDSDFIWKIGIENPENLQEMIAIYDVKNGAVATSGRSKKGDHLTIIGTDDLSQVTIVGEKIGLVDIWATAGFSAGQKILDQLIVKHQLTGLYLQQSSLHVFQKGQIHHVKTI